MEAKESKLAKKGSSGQQQAGGAKHSHKAGIVVFGIIALLLFSVALGVIAFSDRSKDGDDSATDQTEENEPQQAEDDNANNEDSDANQNEDSGEVTQADLLNRAKDPAQNVEARTAALNSLADSCYDSEDKACLEEAKTIYAELQVDSVIVDDYLIDLNSRIEANEATQVVAPQITGELASLNERSSACYAQEDYACLESIIAEYDAVGELPLYDQLIIDNLKTTE